MIFVVDVVVVVALVVVVVARYAENEVEID